MKERKSLFGRMAYASCFGLLTLISACAGGGGSAAVVNLQSLSGFIHSAGGVALQDVTVSVHASQGEISVRTDANGGFIIPSIGVLPVGSVMVVVDGATATATGPLDYPKLEVLVSLPAGTTALLMPQVITLPDLNNVDSANQSLPLANLAATAPILVEQSGGQALVFSLSGPTGTVFSGTGLDMATVGVDLNVTAVPSDEVPMPLPDDLQGTFFVTIQPGNASFNPPGAAQGLDLLLPNDMDLPVGMLVDIWSFDHDDGEWVNRSLQTGEQGIVRLVGAGPDTEIFAAGVVTEGGWHAGTFPVDPTCGTTVTGRVVDDNGVGIEGASLAFSTGQFYLTNSDGFFTTGVLPSYDAGALFFDGTCTASEIGFTVFLPLNLGGLSSQNTILAGSVITGGTTNIADVVFTLGTEGSLAGVVIGDHAINEQVVLTPDMGMGLSLTPNGNGIFFASGLEQGNWTADFLFTGESSPTSVPFVIEANELTTIAIQLATGGGGGETITVLVLEDGDGIDTTPMTPCEGATVFLQGSDSGSSVGLLLITNSDGEAFFQGVAGDYNVTVQKDVLNQTSTTRYASSVISIAPISGVIGIPLLTGEPNTGFIVDSLLDGTVMNMPVLGGTEFLRIDVEQTGMNGEGFGGTVNVNPATGAFSLQVPSGMDFDVALVHADAVGTPALLGTLILPAVGQIASGATLTVDPDYSSATAWGLTTNVTLNDMDVGAFVNVSTIISDDTGMRFDFVLLPAVQPNTFTAQLPDLALPAFNNLEFKLQANAVSPAGTAQTCVKTMTSNPASLAMGLLESPDVTDPVDGAILTVPEMNVLQVDVTPGANGLLGNNGLDIFSLISEEIGGGKFPGAPELPPGISQIQWTVFLAEGTTSFVMPPAALPMYDPNIDVDFLFQKARVAGFAFDYNSFFGLNLGSNWESLLSDPTERCSSYTGGTLLVR